MNSTGYFSINTTHITFEAFEDEVVLINLENGNYYSLDGTSAFIWNLIQSGMHVSEILGKLYQNFNGSKEVMENNIRQFIDELLKEKLIFPSDKSECEKTKISNDIALNEPIPNKIPFTPPILNRYTDMQDLLLLDPIHEVDESGWPIVPPEDASEKEIT